MERAKKVRTAMAMVIDREQLVADLTDCFGRVAYTPDLSTADPIYKREWDTPYDVAGAQSLMSEAGLSDGFNVEWWISPTLRASEAISEQAIIIAWHEHLNINSSINSDPYSDFRRSLISRTNQMLTVSRGVPLVPANWPRERYSTSIGRASGYNRGIEIPIFAETYLAMSQEPDVDKQHELVTAMVDWNREWMVWAGLYQSPTAPLYNSEAISEWKMLPEGRGVLGGINSLEWVPLPTDATPL